MEYVRCVSRIEHLARTYWFDLLIALLAIVAMLDVVLGRGSSGAPTTTLWFCLPALAILVLPVFARRWFPFAGPAAYWLLAAGISFVDPLLIPYPESLFLIGLAAAFLLGNLRDVRRAGLGLAIVVGAAATLVYNIPGHSVDQLVFIPVDFAVAWVAGLAVRARAEQAEVAESRATQAEHAVFEERVRIARELHDVVAHHVSMMGVQAGAARVVIDRDRVKAKEALTAIEVSSRQAVGELHRLLGFLRQAGDEDDLLAPRPGLSQLPRLAASMSESELAVAVSIEGEERLLPPMIGVSAYRIVQEALTNTLKHAAASRADVRVRYWPDELEVEIIDDGRGATALIRDEPGRPGVDRHARACRPARRPTDGGAGIRRRVRRARQAADLGRCAVSIRVLLADDQAMVRAGFRMILESDPEIEVVGEAANGEQAMASTRRLRPDIVLMDIQMPDGDGLEATRRITEDGELHSRVVILTTFERDEYVFEALRSGASGFLLKNAPPEELLHAVHVVTAGEALLAPSVTRRIIEQFARRPVRPELGTRLDALTQREREVLRMLAHGKSNAELAAELFVSEGTIKTHVSSLLAKLGLRDRVQAVVLAYESGLVTPGA